MSAINGDLFKLVAQGVYIVGVADGEQENAFTAAWVMQVSFTPPMLVISINPEHYSFKLLRGGGCCSVNVLGRHQYSLADHFGKSGGDKMAVGRWQKRKTGAPVLVESLAYFDCKVSHYTEAGDHQLVICEVVDAGLLNPGEPLLYSETGDMDGSSALYR